MSDQKQDSYSFLGCRDFGPFLVGSYHKTPYDPGWNDPPTFNYSNAPPPTKTKLNLNKRIAFPIQSSAKSDDLPKVEKSGGLGGGLPLPFAKVQHNVIESNTVPVTSNLPLLPPPSMTNEIKSCESNQESNYSSDRPQNKDDTGNSYEFVMKTLRDINKSLMSTDSSKVEEIDKRLNMLEAVWNDEKIDDKLKVLLVKTAEALQENQFSVAIDIQRTIIVDYGSNICAQWGPALRQLILLKESKSKPVTESVPDTSVVDEPKFINPLDDLSNVNSKCLGRVKHL